MSSQSLSERLHEALRDAFTPAELGRLVHWNLNEWLHNVARPAGTHDEQVTDLIDWCTRRGRLGELIKKAAQERPSRADLQDILSDWNALIGGPSSAVPVSQADATPQKMTGSSLASMPPPPGMDSHVASLAHSYSHVHRSMGPGSQRVDEERRILEELSKRLEREGPSEEHLAEWCVHPDSGIRLGRVDNSWVILAVWVTAAGS